MDKNQESMFGERMRRSSLHSHTRSDSKGKVSIDSTDSRSSVVFSECVCYLMFVNILIHLSCQMILSLSHHVMDLPQTLLLLDRHLVLQHPRVRIRNGPEAVFSFRHLML